MTGVTEAMRGTNPWPEESDYGVKWRMGFQAGRSDAIAQLVPIAMTTAAPEKEMVGLDTLPTNYELSWCEIDGDPSECCWHVHSVNGGRNDRQWNVVARGETPSEAVTAALNAARKQP